jgi:hypothetical protein
MVCTVSIAIPRGSRTPQAVLGFDAEGLGAYHLGDVGPDVNSSSVLMTLIGLPLDSSQQPVCLVPRLSGGNCSL